MAACEIQISNPSVLEKIESFINDTAYSEVIENSASYNSRICLERRLRMPFLDTHTGVVQNHSDLFKTERQRMPGFLEGQVYTYPSKRWCKRRRQYLMNWVPRKTQVEDGDSNTGDNPIVNEDSKDSAGLKEESVKDTWYYEDEMIEMDVFDEPDPDSDFDYEDSYRGRKKKSRSKPSTRRGSRQTQSQNSPKGEPETPASGGRGGRGRKRALLYDMDNDKPFACELCSARYKTRPGLTYHYTHTHKETKECDVSNADSGENSMERGSPKQAALGSGPVMPPMSATVPVPANIADPNGPPGSAQFQDSYLTFLKVPGNRNTNSNARGRQSSALMAGPPVSLVASAPTPLAPTPSVSGASGGSGAPPPKAAAPPVAPLETKKELKDDKPASSATASPATATPATNKDAHEEVPPEMVPYKRMALPDDKARVAASPYCDFCLGDTAQNKKTSNPEELVSCSDCGRSGHPTCLQFTQNMIVSVRKYRWQCIECKCCSVCGTSDNDDQLLFCDDCDRGYHMYCLAPPLMSPPEGSWSCGLCLIEFHRK